MVKAKRTDTRSGIQTSRTYTAPLNTIKNIIASGSGEAVFLRQVHNVITLFCFVIYCYPISKHHLELSRLGGEYVGFKQRSSTWLDRLPKRNFKFRTKKKLSLVNVWSTTEVCDSGKSKGTIRFVHVDLHLFGSVVQQTLGFLLIWICSYRHSLCIKVVKLRVLRLH
mgnify:CR=1 FL=1